MLQPNDRTGIMRYDSGNTKTPTTEAFQFSAECSEEPYESLVPIVLGYVGAKDASANDNKSASPYIF